MAYWWVNQGRTFQMESAGGFLWAPVSVERANPAWDAVSQLKPGDVVFSHVQREIVAIASVTRSAVQRPQPYPPSAERAWSGQGHFVRVHYEILDKPLSVAANRELLEPLMPRRYAPMNRVWDANQGYMYSIPPELGRLLIWLAEADVPTSDEEPGETLESAIKSSDLPSTEQEALIKARRGQGKFRDAVMRLWASQCAVTAMTLPQLLRASHIKPWADGNNAERLDEFNGLLLSPALDAAFDRGYISFTPDTGRLQISSQLDMNNASKIGIRRDMQLVRVPADTGPYLQYHQAHVFRK